MPRKNPRPQAKKRRAKLKAKIARKADFRQASRNYRQHTAGLDQMFAAALAAGIFGGIERPHPVRN